MDGRLQNEMKIEKNIESLLRDCPDYVVRWNMNMKVSRRTAATRRLYIGQVRNFLMTIKRSPLAVKVSDITEAKVEEYLLSHQVKDIHGEIKETSDTFQCTNWSILKSFFDYLMHNGLIERNYMDAIQRPKNKDLDRINEHRVLLTDKDFRKILRAIDEDQDGEWIRKRNKAIILLFMNTGMRKTALLTLNLNNIDLAGRKINIIDKGNKRHEYIINDQLAAALTEWLAVRDDIQNQDDHLFISLNGTGMAGTTLTLVVKKYTRRALGREISPHKLRAGYCSILYNKTGDIEFVRRAVGHSNVATTQRYIVTKGAEKEKAAEIMGSIL